MTRPTRHEVRVGLKLAMGLLLALVVPGMACYCWYSVTDIAAARAGWAPAVALSVPLALLSAIGLCAALLTAVRRPAVVRACAVVLALSGGLLLVARTHAFGF